MIVFVSCFKQHGQQIIRPVSRFFPLDDDCSDQLSCTLCQFQMFINGTTHPEPPTFIGLANFFYYKCLKNADKPAQFCKSVFFYRSAEQCAGNNPECELIHFFIGIKYFLICCKFLPSFHTGINLVYHQSLQ